MRSNNLIVSVLMSFSLLTLSACKQSGSNNKTSIRKTRTGQTATKPGNTDPAKAGTGTGVGTGTGTQAGTDGKGGATTSGGTGTPSDVTAKPGEKVTCASIEQAAKSNGWKLNSIEVPEATGSSKKIKIVYYTLDKSDLTNPVLYFNRSAFQSTDANELARMSKLASDYKIDFVLMDMRGSGCSSALPDIKTKTAELANYSSKNVVADAEAIRKHLLKDNKWKIMAHRSGGVVALRYVQLFPAGVKSIHIADFYPVKNQASLMKARVEKESELWKTIAEEQKISDATVEKALKNLEAEKCTGLSNCKVLIDLFGGIKISQKDQWTTIASTINDLAEGKAKASDLMKIYEGRKQMNDLSTAARLMDIDSDKSLSACATVIKDDNKGVINSCRLEVELRKSELPTLKNLAHNALGASIIKSNLVKEKIEYHLYLGGNSALYPSEGSKEHTDEMGDAVKQETVATEGSEVFLNENFLKTMR